MSSRNNASERNRRSFLKEITAAGGAYLLAGCASSTTETVVQVPALSDWTKQIGLELFTVRDVLSEDYEGTLAKLAEIGYTEVEPADPYNNMEPKQYKALLDKYGLKMFSTHSGATDGPDLEKELEGQALMGIKYTDVQAPREEGAEGRGRGSGGAPEGTGVRGEGPPGGRGAQPQRPPQTVESVKQSAAQLNKYGAITQKFGMKMHIHNHAGEFDLLENSDLTQYDVLLAETDPDLVAMQIDIGWAAVAGQDVIEMFKKNPGRYELWHVKDVVGLANNDPETPAGQRQGTFVPVGQGEIDYRTIFANAELAGLKYFVIEQDNAAEGGDSVAVARANYEGLVRVLS